MLTPTAILYAAAETARRFERNGARITGTALTDASFRLEGTTSAGARLVVLAVFTATAGGATEVSVSSQVGRTCKTHRAQGDTAEAAVAAALGGGR